MQQLKSVDGKERKEKDMSTEKAVPLGAGEPKKTTQGGVTLYLGKPEAKETKEKKAKMGADPAVERHFGKSLEIISDLLSKAENVNVRKAAASGPGMGGGVTNPPSARIGGGVKLSAPTMGKATPISLPTARSIDKAHDKCPKCDKTDCQCVDKALSARSIPRLPRALVAALRADPMRSGAMVLTTPGGTPLHGQLLDELPEDAERRDQERLERSYGTYKSCSGCGRRYLAKSADAECPTCSVNKSLSCSGCGRMLIKSHGGGPATCPICL
jgi:hypothetical protein